MTQQTHHGRIYSGDLYIKKYGSDDGWVILGNVTELKTKSDIEKNELIGRGKYNYGQAIDSVITPKPTEVSITFDSFDKNALAQALMGELVENAGSATPINKEIKAKKGVWIDLGVTDINPEGFVVKTKSPSKALDKADYELNANLGMIKLNDTEATKALTDDSDLVVTGNTKGQASIQIDAGTLHNLELELKLDGRDRITGKEGVLHIPHAVLSADGELDWLSEDWLESGLSGTAVKDEGKPVMRFVEFG